MRGRGARKAIAISSAGLVVLGSAMTLAACQQSQPSEGGAAQTDLKIVEQVPIDENGAEITPPDTAAAADPAGDGKAQCPPVSIAMAGALNGPDAALGINIKNGIQLAVDQHNAANPGCKVQLKAFDTEGDPQKASQTAPQIINDASIIGLIGPAFSGETMATGDVYNQAGLVAATASATNVTLSQKGWKTFFRGLGNDGQQGQAVGNYLKNSLGHKKVCVVDDSTDYGLGLATVVRNTLGAVADPACNISVKKGDKDFSAAVTQIKGASPDSVFFSGYYAEAAPFAQQLKDGGYTGTFVSADGTKDPEFVKQAGNAAEGAILSCPCTPAPAEFAEEYKKAFNADPGTYSVEGYDLGTIMLKGIDSGKTTRPDLLEFVRTYNGQGIGRKYQWDPNGELTSTLIWIFKVQ
ncbi:MULTISPECIES: branched-chain amino acid ABC transporter substrate-binding protein [unclassified Mycobacterium]|uniref:branched-chain amino acid ABC transporter substrate-binding protein n=1 Tax=unclassified Mycobacterium TaxID=2642494 RepID=UPI00073FBB5C|nr:MULTISPECIES: branched-chain amino acid ABC transporter substrate-binding protein [unclassified Mycobacterium]KUH88370.1 branched chain amino acid ABC transporter substrate-binding protein [Mycobacterium sp. GA-1999]KUH90908.1 branched chain amino acid ABC transporter substrate-binding protein [Mycobacterium sp. GA-0227b]KUH91197.1 branched chain amino acid ABC transporter substrate-binding protein [Mycobacterium sp. IS-1556]